MLFDVVTVTRDNLRETVVQGRLSRRGGDLGGAEPRAHCRGPRHAVSEPQQPVPR